MKKNIMRVISLVLVAAMVFAFASCTQTIYVRFVDADGNDISIGGIANANGTPAGTTAAPTVDTPTQAPSNTPTQAPSNTPTQAPSDTPTQAPSADTPTQAPSTDTPTQAPAASSVPSTPAQIADFYKAAATAIKNNGAAGYTKKEWQELTALNVLAGADSVIKGLAGNYMTSADKAENQVSAKGSDEAKDRFPGFTLTDYSKIASATCTKNASGNYDVKIVMIDEDTPMSTGSITGQVTNSVLYWDSNIEPELKNISLIKNYDGIHVVYQHFTIEAEMTADGKFVSMKQTADVDIAIGSLKISFFTMSDKSGHLVNYATYSDFSY